MQRGNSGGNRARQQMLPSLQAPLGSLANRIFNPPSPEKLEAVEEANAEAAAVKTAAAESVAMQAVSEPAAAADESSVSTAPLRELPLRK
jgi:hypothetical protein